MIRLPGAATRRTPWRPGLRWRATAAFTLGGLVLSTVLAGATYTLTRGYLIGQREDSALRQAYADASYVRNGLLTAGAEPSEVMNCPPAPEPWRS